MSPETVQPGKALDFFAITVEPEPRFSYGLLHNNRDLFRRFLIRNLSAGPVVGVQVFVELHSNEGTYPYRQSFSIDDTVLDLSSQVRIALTSDLARTLDEVLRTSLYVQINWGAHEIFRQTFPVTMAPVDQWADTDTDRIFLPSFIFPRDRAVTTVIKSAEHFVTTLRDDPTAGFDGYQSIDPELANPAQHVDSQVQALWYSVVYRVPVSYINPPPTYAVSSQRIRTPSEIVAGGFGTCIDLALMLASCLEAVEIYPVIFLLDDHAFPGYWRTDAGRDTFRRRVASSASDSDGGAQAPPEATPPRPRDAPAPAWCFGAAALAEIRRAIERNQLVPLESVGLTGRWSLADAVRKGARTSRRTGRALPHDARRHDGARGRSDSAPVGSSAPVARGAGTQCSTDTTMQRAVVSIGVKKTGGLPELQAAVESATEFAEWARELQKIPASRVKLITDAKSPVSRDRIFETVEKITQLGFIEQLIVYFSGHGINSGLFEQWLLSRAPDDPAAAVDVKGSEFSARFCGIGHVVFISDACRTAADSIQAQRVTGAGIFPNAKPSGPERPVDQFFATRVGDPALEVKTVEESTSRFRAVVLEGAAGGVARRRTRADPGVGRRRIHPPATAQAPPG